MAKIKRKSSAYNNFKWFVGGCIFTHQVMTFFFSYNLSNIDGISRVNDARFPAISTIDNSEQANSRETKYERLLRFTKLYNYNHPAPVVTDPNLCGDGPDFTKYFNRKNKKKAISRFHEDKIIYTQFFKSSKIKGTFVELGAFDGIVRSNSLFFERCLGWKGLLIEGSPKTYQKLIQNRPQAHCMNFSPTCASNNTIPYYDIPLPNSGLPGKALAYHKKNTVNVPCGPLGPVLQDIFEGERISFFSLDVEGSEPEVLATIDFQKNLIEVMIIEIGNKFCKKSCKSRDQIRAKMKEAGYERYENMIHSSDVYVHPSSRFQLPRKI